MTKQQGQHDYGESWDDSDVKTLLEHADAGLTHRQIAEKMGRSENGVGSKLYRIRHQRNVRASS